MPGDSSFTRFSTTQFTATWVNLTANSTQGWLDDFSLTPLSTTYSYDLAGNLEESRRPDGSRTRLYRDRWARVVAWEDSLGQRSLAAYDSRSRMIAFSDPLGNQTAFGYDPNDNLVSLTNALASPFGVYGSGIYGVNAYVSPSQETQFRYNSRDLLSSIIYQDSTSEQFEYDGAGNLTSYRDNQARLRTFSYDQDERLTTIQYSDATTVVLSYDKVGNVLTRRERNSDLNTFAYDALNRMVGEIHALGGATGVAWTHGQKFDAASNRTDFSYHASEYGAAIYGTDVYGTGPATWRVADAAYGTARFGADLYQAGYDSMNRMPGSVDAASNTVHFCYDYEGRRTQIVYPFGTSPVTTTASYDITGRLLSQATQMGVSSLLQLRYGYDQNSNRIGMVAGLDGWDYDLDASNRLVAANLNTWVDQLPTHFGLGSCSATCLRPGGAGVMLLAYNDSFSGSVMNNDRWRVTLMNPGAPPPRFLDVVGAEFRQKDGLLMAYPRGFSDLGPAAAFNGWADPFGLDPNVYSMSVE